MLRREFLFNRRDVKNAKVNPVLCDLAVSGL